MEMNILAHIVHNNGDFQAMVGRLEDVLEESCFAASLVDVNIPIF